MLLKKYKVVGNNIFKREHYRGSGSYYCDGCKYYLLSSGSFAVCLYKNDQICVNDFINDFSRWAANLKGGGQSSFVYYPL